MKINNMRKDGHVHSPYCPHGSNDSFEMYVEKAIKEGLNEISFTEHMPFPLYFMEDREFLDECSPKNEMIEKYFNDLEKIKEKYKNIIKINRGLEVDFIDGYEEKTKELLNLYGSKLDDSLLSIHFINIGNEYCDIDGENGFSKAVQALGSVEKVYDKYYETLLKAIKSDLGKFKPKRIGHPNLIRIFNKIYPIEYKNIDLLENIVIQLKARDYEVDVNTAGLRKEYCGEIYVSDIFKELVEQYEVRKVYGSDAHIASDVGIFFNKA